MACSRPDNSGSWLKSIMMLFRPLWLGVSSGRRRVVLFVEGVGGPGAR